MWELIYMPMLPQQFETDLSPSFTSTDNAETNHLMVINQCAYTLAHTYCP